MSFDTCAAAQDLFKLRYRGLTPTAHANDARSGLMSCRSSAESQSDRAHRGLTHDSHKMTRRCRACAANSVDDEWSAALLAKSEWRMAKSGASAHMRYWFHA